ncbi:hypothetical protein [Rhizobium laguerreae]|uniref:hypothetical protein n=1 Tax=Rhizobium laguerreae TaxID=1076926 RepID=UPI001441561A|nr:hypothetical protein [Rhizobium laguerreae]MBY3207557.1 hypothetical protein [Rhizobium laguerreae]MBY3330623.1 hypothetical protein [Rhizobium laguerreae]NKN10994.1 hypothetical protein [Rhizobium laguerreae]
MYVLLSTGIFSFFLVFEIPGNRRRIGQGPALDVIGSSLALFPIRRRSAMVLRRQTSSGRLFISHYVPFLFFTGGGIFASIGPIGE